MKIIKLPTHFGHNSFDIILDEKENIISTARKDPKELIFDVSETESISMLGLLLILSICDAVGQDCKCTVSYGKPISESNMANLMEIMGAVKSQRNKETEEVLDSIRVPVRRCFNGNENLAAVNHVIRIVKNEFNPSTEVLNALNWALWELVDNAGMHGYNISEFGKNYPKPLYFCAFDYKDTIEIAILDVGRGIHNSFLESGLEKYKDITSEQSLLLAIKDGVTSKPGGSMGFGLFGCSEIAKYSNGSLIVISGNNKLMISSAGVNAETCSKFDGTMVSLRMPRDAIVNLKGIFGENSLVLDSIEDVFGI